MPSALAGYSTAINSADGDGGGAWFSITFTSPGSVQSGDLLHAVFLAKAVSLPTPPTPALAGWTVFGGFSLFTGGPILWHMQRVAEAGEPSSYAFTLGGSGSLSSIGIMGWWDGDSLSGTPTIQDFTPSDFDDTTPDLTSTANSTTQALGIHILAAATSIASPSFTNLVTRTEVVQMHGPPGTLYSSRHHLWLFEEYNNSTFAADTFTEDAPSSGLRGAGRYLPLVGYTTPPPTRNKNRYARRRFDDVALPYDLRNIRHLGG